jgi:adenosylmethionine-8-amino-7-oxononanoate aminotransferase
LLIADEVMTGFGRTGRWFGLDHWGVRPDILVSAKGATSGYWPFGFVAASDEVHGTVSRGSGFVHGFTYSHGPVAAAVAGEVLRILETENLVEASAAKGARLLAGPGEAGEQPLVGDRGVPAGRARAWWRIAVRASPSHARGGSPSRWYGAARARGLLVYSGTGNANGVDGDTILLGPPFIITDLEIERVIEGLAESVATIAVADAVG